ncbi:MAG: ParB/RepB/Spo0J family partition protein [Ruminococcus sp.]
MAGILTFEKEQSVNRVVEIHISEIYPNPNQYGMNLASMNLQPLAENIARNGVLQPLTVRHTDAGYELIAGVRRLYAAKLAGLQSVPCTIIEPNARNTAIMALVEEIQRQNLNFFEEAAAIEKLISFYGMTQEDAAARLGKAQSTIANKLRLLRLTGEERELIIQHHLTERHARALLRLGAPQERMLVLNQVIKQGLNVEKTELAVEEMIGRHKKREPYRKRTRSVQNVRTFVNAISKAVETMQSAGIGADAQRIQNEDSVEFRIRIPYHASSDHPVSKRFTTYH